MAPLNSLSAEFPIIQPEDQPAAKARWSIWRPKRIGQYRLRTLMFVVLGVSVLLAAFVWRRDRARKQEHAIRAISDLNGRALYDCEVHRDEMGWVCENARYCFTDKPHVVSMLKHRLGYSFFHNVVYVSYSAESPKSLSIAPPFWSAIEELNHLQRINFEGCQIDVRDLSRHVQRPSTLQMLGLAKCKVRDEELAALCRFRSLTWLNLADTPIGDEGMKSIGKLHDLKLLCLWNTAATDEGLCHIEPLSKLVWLGLNGTGVRFEGRHSLARFEHLETLELQHTGVGDTGLMRLAMLPSLRELDVRDTLVTRSGAQQFMNERPDVRLIPYSPSPFKVIE